MLMPDSKQLAYEAQTRQFEEHVKHFEQLDEVLQLFAIQHGFALEKNQWHRPCRVLRRKSNPEYVIELVQEGDWKKVLYREDLPYTLTVIAQTTDEKQEFIYRLDEELAYFVHFSTIRSNLQQTLETALARIQEWPIEVIRRDGSKSKHPMAYYREQGGIKIQTVD